LIGPPAPLTPRRGAELIAAPTPTNKNDGNAEVMVIDHRTYTFHPLKMPKWLALYEEYGLPVQLKHLGRLIGFFQNEIGTLNQVVHLWGFDDLNDRQRRRAEMAQDPAWAEFMRRNEELGALMHQESKIVTPVRFSPIQ
jgi:NIPSNAP